jgi:diguanylate cyclase (GGDEF)-like protein
MPPGVKATLRNADLLETMKPGDESALRRAIIGRLAGMLFMLGALASVPSNAAFTDPAVGQRAWLIDALAFVSGLVCFYVPWARFSERWFHVLPAAGTAETALSVWGIGIHGGIYSWYYVLVAVFVAYAFSSRLQIAAHMGFVGICFALPALYLPDPYANTAAVRVGVAVPVLLAVAAVVAYLREGLEQGKADLAEQARTDALTGVANFRTRDERLAYEITRHRRTGRELAVLVLDLDRFKEVNDTLGHLAGDRLLREVAAVLLKTVREGDTVSRPGGDEFCLIAPETGAAEAAAMVARVKAALAGLVAVGEPLSAAVGVAVFPHDGQTPEQVMERADRDERLDKQANGRAHDRARVLHAV